jgi:hypothetical protein
VKKHDLGSLLLATAFGAALAIGVSRLPWPRGADPDRADPQGENPAPVHVGRDAIAEQKRQLDDQMQTYAAFDRNAGSLLGFSAAAIGILIGLIGKLSVPDSDVAALVILLAGLASCALFCTMCLNRYRLEAGPPADTFLGALARAPYREAQAALVRAMVRTHQINRRVTIAQKRRDWNRAVNSIAWGLGLAVLALGVGNVFEHNLLARGWDLVVQLVMQATHWVRHVHV